MSACNQNCSQGRQCDCVENESYASSTVAPGHRFFTSDGKVFMCLDASGQITPSLTPSASMQRGPLSVREIRGMQNAYPQSDWMKECSKKDTIAMIEPDHWQWLGDIGKSFLAVLACAVVGVIVIILLGPK